MKPTGLYFVIGHFHRIVFYVYCLYSPISLGITIIVNQLCTCNHTHDENEVDNINECENTPTVNVANIANINSRRINNINISHVDSAMDEKCLKTKFLTGNSSHSDSDDNWVDYTRLRFNITYTSYL